MTQANISLALLSIALILSLPNCMFSTKPNGQNSNQTQGDSVVSDNTETGFTAYREIPDSEIIKLFVYKNCPYCHKVITALKNSGNLGKVTVLDVAVPENMAELKALNNNNTQCPFLHDVDKNVKMLESSDIIKYFSTRF
jgi:hypothetical protein